MNEQILQKIDELFNNRENNEEFTNLKKSITFDCKKLYNQMLQSGFSEYIAVAECVDYVDKISKLIENENDINKIKDLLSEEKKLKDNIKNTTSDKKINDDYDHESIDNIIKIVEDAALESENLHSTDILDQNDEIVYKSKEENVKSTTNEAINQKHKWSKQEKKKYFISLFSFFGILGLTALVIYLIHQFAL